MPNIRILPNISGYNGINSLVAIGNTVVKIDRCRIYSLEKLLNEAQIKDVKITKWSIHVFYIDPKTGEEEMISYDRENPDSNYNAFLDEDCDN